MWVMRFFKKNRNDKETAANNQKERQIKCLEHIEVKGLVNLTLTRIYWKQEKQGETNLFNQFKWMDGRPGSKRDTKGAKVT